MKEINIEAKDSLAKILNSVLTSNSREIRLKIAENSILFKNILNLKILAKITKQSGIVLKLETTSETGKKMISKLWKGQRDEEYVSPDEEQEKEIELPATEVKKKMTLPKFEFNKSNLVVPIIAGVAIVALVVGYFLITSKLSANVVIKVGAERFVKSFEVKLSTVANTDIQNKVLRVDSLTNSFSATKEIDTTGKADGGVKASGEVKLVNNTDKEITVKSGTKLTLDLNAKEYVFALNDDVVVPARTQTSSSPVTYVNGEKTAKASATGLGSAYNISAGKDLVVSGYKDTELSAIISSSFSGGIKNSGNVVAAADLKNVSDQSLGDFKSAYTSNISGGKTPIKNSEIFKVNKETFSGKLSDPIDKIKVTQDVSVSTFVYDSNEAKAFVNGSIKSLLPKGFELYGKDLEIEINALGTTDKTVLNNQEADAQITVKSYKIPLFDTKGISKDLAGMSFDNVESYMSKLDNVINYDIELNYNLPLVKNLPKDSSKINVTISKE